jgi:hypothetical protein
MNATIWREPLWKGDHHVWGHHPAPKWSLREEKSHMSEVARIRAQIQAEYEASKRALTDPSIVAPHRLISKRMQRLELLRKELLLEVGEAEGMRIFAEISEQSAPEMGGHHASL